MKKLLLLSFVLIALYLLFRNSKPYAKAVTTGTDFFSKIWLALTTGKQ